ncbi:MAG: folate family ECF transporter S component [Clostridia bacterium]|nr:folate family ECF transporter S component [Clostridia bacterium]
MFNLLAPSAFDFKAIFSNVLSEWYYYLTFILIVLTVIFLVVKFKPQEKVELKKTHKLSIIAILSALCVIANIFSFGSDFVKFSFVSVVCFIAGFTLGPIGGLAVGFIGDFLAGIIFPFGVYNPIIALGSALFGFIPGIIFHYFKGNNIIKTVVSFIICYVVCSVLLNTTATYFMYLHGNSAKYQTVFAYLVARIPTTAITQGINLVISILLLPALNKIKETLLKK